MILYRWLGISQANLKRSQNRLHRKYEFKQETMHFLCALAIEMKTYAKTSKKWKECSGRGPIYNGILIIEFKDHNCFSQSEGCSSHKINNVFNSVQLLQANVKYFSQIFFRDIPQNKWNQPFQLLEDSVVYSHLPFLVSKYVS